MVKIGVYVLGVAAIATGIINLIWGDFEAAHEPIQAWGDTLSGRGLFADAVAIALILGGVAIIRRKSARFGAIAVALAYFVFAIFWLRRLHTAAEIVGWRAQSERPAAWQSSSWSSLRRQSFMRQPLRPDRRGRRN